MCYLIMRAALVGLRTTEGVVSFGVMSFPADAWKIMWENIKSQLTA
jgi:hypothetical protein